MRDDLLDEDPSPPDVLRAIAQALAQVDRAGDFYACGEHPVPVAGLSIEGLGPMPLPLVPAVVAALEPLSTPAPYGRGGETLVDPDVRRCRQLTADVIQAGSPAWQAMLDGIVRAAAAGLGVDGPVTAHLYKLLLYGPGDFFVPHRDSEKEDGMLGTLVLVLPSDFSGGQLVVCHGGVEQTLPLQPSAPDRVSWAAFYADCLHEIRPLQDGVRAVLIYNLVRTGSPLQPPDHREAEARLRGLLTTWREQGHPVKLCYALEHRYTPAELGWDRLKGADQARVQVLARAAGALGMTAHLAMVSVSESWSAQAIYGGGWYSRYEEPVLGPDDVELYDMYDRSRSVTGWRSATGPDPDLPDLAFDLEEVVPAGALDCEEPDDFHYQEATGNEGATVERTFRRAALVIWPPEQDVAVLSQGGADALFAALEAVPPGHRERAEALAAAASSMLRGRHERRHPLLLARIARDRLAGAARAWLDQRGPEDLLAPDLDQALAAVLDLLPADQAGGRMAALLSRGDWNSMGPHAALLDAVLVHARHPHQTWAPAVDALLGRFRTGPTPPAEDRWWRPHRIEDSQLAGLLHLVLAVRPQRSEDLLDMVQDHPDLVRFDAAVVPAVTTVHDRLGPVPALAAWIGHVRSILEPRVAEPPQPPLDLRRAPPTGCSCERCRTLAAFMQDPARDELRLKLRKDLRQHLHQVVQRQRLDAVTHTIRQGRPYTLVVTKTLRSYEDAMREHQRDLAALAVLHAPA